MRALLSILTFCISFIALVTAEEQAARRVDVFLAPGQSSAEALPILEMLGFVPSGSVTDGSLLTGKATDKVIEALSASKLVSRIAVGPVVAAAPRVKPAQYKVRLRYYIEADRTRHALEFRRMLAALQAAGFVKDKGLEQEELYDEPISGVLPAAGVKQLLKAPYLQTALLVPEGTELPDGNTPVFVSMELTNRPGVTRQQELRNATLAMLKRLGWIPSHGHDHRDHSRLLGWLPANQLESVLLAKTGREPTSRRNLQIDMALPSSANPFDVNGWVLVNVTVTYKPTELHDELLASLETLGFEPAQNGESQEGLTGIFRGRLPTRTLARARALDGVLKVDVEPGTAIERITPVLAIEVLPEPEGSQPPAVAEEAAGEPGFSKLSPDLRKYLAEVGENVAKPIRVEVVLRGTPGEFDENWRESVDNLRGALGIEGRLGPLVTGLVRPTDIKLLAERDEVSSIRLPQMARPLVLPPFDPSKPAELPVDFAPLGRQANGTGDLAALPRRRSPQRAAVLDSDFRGYAQFVGKGLPKKTQLLDFTPERSPQLQADPVVGDPDGIGNGTRLALALMATAPADELVLIRINPESPYMLEQVVRGVEGRGWRSEATALREDELRREHGRLDEERAQLRGRRRLVLNNFGEDEDARAARDAYFQAQRDFDAREQDFKARQARFVKLVTQAESLKDLNTVLIGLRWEDGHPVLPGTGLGNRYLGLHRGDASAPLPKASWIQAIPRSEAATWHGIFRDLDNDAAMDFHSRADAGSRQKDLTFLAWKPHAWHGAKAPEKVVWQELPAGAVIQATLQWQEVHSPHWKQDRGQDHYRQPLAPLRLVILKQRDPHGKTALPGDAYEVVARSPAWVDRVENDRRTATYEISARFQVPEGGGRYAVRIEGAAPESTLPPGTAALPNAQRAELKPLLKLDVIDPAHRAEGQVVLETPTAAKR